MARYALATASLVLTATAEPLDEQTALLQLTPLQTDLPEQTDLLQAGGSWETLPGACRLDTHDKTPDGKGSVVLKTADTLSTCQKFCEESEETCWGVEYKLKGAPRCELWMKPIGHNVDNSAYGCYTYINTDVEKSIMSGLWTSLGADTACRLGAGDSSIDGQGSVELKSAASLRLCKAECVAHDSLAGASCYAIEYNKENHRCEVWTQPVDLSVGRSGYECIRYGYDGVGDGEDGFNPGTDDDSEDGEDGFNPGTDDDSEDGASDPVEPVHAASKPAPLEPAKPTVCKEDTGETCSVWSCSSSLGQTDCKKDESSWATWNCLCKEGYCFDEVKKACL